MSKCDRDPYSGRPPEHEYGPWEPREEGGFIIYTRGTRVGHLEPFTYQWQERICKECGQAERYREDLFSPPRQILASVPR